MFRVLIAKKGNELLSLSLSLSRSLPFSKLTTKTPAMEGRSRRERAPKRGAAALAALARLRGNDDEGAAPDAKDIDDASTAPAPAPSRRRRQLDDFEVKDADAVYDVVDEDEYADLVAKRRREGGEDFGGERVDVDDETSAMEKMRVEEKRKRVSRLSRGPALTFLPLAMRSRGCDGCSNGVERLNSMQQGGRAFERCFRCFRLSMLGSLDFRTKNALSLSLSILSLKQKNNSLFSSPSRRLRRRRRRRGLRRHRRGGRLVDGRGRRRGGRQGQAAAEEER